MTGCPSAAMEDSTSVRSATLESMIPLATRAGVFELLLLLDRVAALDDGPPKVIQSRKSLKDSILVVSARMVAADFGFGDVAEQEERRSTRPSSRKARHSRLFRLCEPSLRSNIDGRTSPAWIERTTCIMSCQWVAISCQSISLVKSASICW